MRNWKVTVKGVDDILARYDEAKPETFTEVRDALVAKLTAEVPAVLLGTNEYGWPLEQLLEELTYAETPDEFEAAWDAIYDWADDAGVWMGF